MFCGRWEKNKRDILPKDHGLPGNFYGRDSKIEFVDDPMFALRAHARQEHLLVEDLVSLALLAGNAVPFTRQTGAALAEARGEPVVGLVDFGEAGGQVLVLADVGLLSFASTTQEGGDNLPFLRNLARFAWSR